MADEHVPQDGAPPGAAPHRGGEPVDFEASLKELEALVAQMEGGSLSLEESLAAFERGVKLTRDCQSALRTAEMRIKALTQDGDEEDVRLPVEGQAPSRPPAPDATQRRSP